MKYLIWFFALGLPFAAEGYTAHGRQARSHQNISRRASGGVQLWKRDFSDTRWTFYAVGLGACGKTNVPSDFIVALNSAQFDVGGGYPGPQCFKFITMTYKGKTAKAQIMDRCPGCPYGGLDLSEGLFTFFADPDLGVLSGNWAFAGQGGNGGNDDPPTQEPPATTHQTTKLTKTRTPTTPTPTPDNEPTSSSSADPLTSDSPPSSASSSTPAIDYSVGVSSSSGLPIPTSILGGQGKNIDSINAALVGLAELLLAGARNN